MGMSCLGQGEGRSCQKEDTSFDFSVSDKAIEGIIARSRQLSAREGRKGRRKRCCHPERSEGSAPAPHEPPGQILRRCARAVAIAASARRRPQNDRKRRLTEES